MIALPPTLGSLKDLKRRKSQAFDTNAQWRDTLDDAYEYFLPQRNLFNTEAKGQKKMDRIFDSTAPNAIQIGASKLQANIAPIWSQWAILGLSKEVEREAEEQGLDVKGAKEKLEHQAEVIFDFINRSNFGTQFFEMALDLLIGTGSLMITEDVDSEDMPIVFHSIPQKDLAFEEGPQGTIETHWRTFQTKARNLERKYNGFEPSQKTRDIIEQKPNTDVTINEGTVFDPKSPNLDSEGKVLSMGKYYGVVWVDGEDHVSWLQDYGESSAWVTGRYFKTSGEVRGRGPALAVYPDVRSLNKAKEFVLQKAAIDLAGMWTATDDGVTNPYSITIAAGMVIPVGSNNTNNPSIVRLDTASNLNLALFEVEQLQNDIKVALFSDLRDPAGPVRSATEIAIDTRELAKRIGSAFGRLQTEVLIPILKRVNSILVKRGILEPIKIGSRDVSVKFTSPLARAQDAEDMLAVQQAVEFTLNTAGPEVIPMSFKVEDFPMWAAEKAGMPTELVRSKAEREAIVSQAAKGAIPDINKQEGAQNVVE